MFKKPDRAWGWSGIHREITGKSGDHFGKFHFFFTQIPGKGRASRAENFTFFSVRFLPRGALRARKISLFFHSDSCQGARSWDYSLAQTSATCSTSHSKVNPLKSCDKSANPRSRMLSERLAAEYVLREFLELSHVRQLQEAI